ncbi:MAG TPA: nuclear transport factor 2 family protein [Gaiellaceae bacterium]|jgi:hypothetical protein|nr:nuclear transport factor 2 family protein [Gaiellaceae bacterium]
MSDSAAVKAFVEDFYRRLGDGDEEVLDTYLSRDEESVVIGTDPNECWTGFETIRRVWGAQIAEMQGFRIVPGNLVARAEGDVGWFADTPKFVLPDGSEAPFGITGVVRRENGGWKLVQGHASFGVPNEEAMGQELTTS